jgi:WD40-like Beta Propeller Repeat
MPVSTFRLAHGIAFATIAAACAWTPSARAGFEPELEWKVLETPHFRITFYSGEREAAEHIADVCETVYDTLGAELGYKPATKVEIAVTDATDSANGSATALPYNLVRLYLTAPDDLSPLGDVDDWQTELITHEYTHILQLDQVSGIPSIINAVLGKTYAPNQVQPRWILEGLATMEESHHTSGGRMRSSLWDMYMRTDVLQNNLATLDQMSNYIRRWPQGNVWYLYGSYFMRYLLDTYGETAIRTFIADYGGRVIPWGINQAMRRATGRTYEELYPAWISTLRERYGKQAGAVLADGVREGVRLTYSGQTAKYPRWIPQNAWSGMGGGLMYYRDDGHDRDGLYGIPSVNEPGRKRFLVDRSKLLARTSGPAAATFSAAGDLVFDSVAPFRDNFSFSDLHELAHGEVNPSGQGEGQKRLTEGMRAAEPSISPDGRRIVFVTNTRGTRYLQIADYSADGIRNVHTLVKSERWEQAFTPRFSPDGKSVAYAAWSTGGFRDIRIVDVATGTFREVARDRAQDGGPAFSVDGKYLFFHSDRTGISNLYAYDLSTSAILQVTNVLTGAFYPEPSPDGKTLAYVGYTKAGFDLFAMPLDASTWTLAKEYVSVRPSVPRIQRKHAYVIRDYNPWSTMAPRSYSFSLTPGNFGQAAVLGIAGQDISGLNAVSAQLTVETERPTLQGTIAYSYSRLPFNFAISAYRQLTPRAGFQLGQGYKQNVVQQTLGVGTSISYSKPKMFSAQSFSLGYSVAGVSVDAPKATPQFDPYETPSYIRGGMLAFLGASYSFSNAERYLNSVSAERGISLGLDLNLTHEALASNYRGFTSTLNLTTYLQMPWLRHHVLALHGGAGISGGSFPGRGAFYVGGFVDLPVVDSVRNLLIQGGIVLRGYEPVAVTGTSYVLSNAEYRFPIWNIDRGASTLPVFLNRINGAFFLDYGSAFDSFQEAQFKTGVGAEAWFDLTLGYQLPFTFRLGYARGLASKGIDKSYFVASVPY